MANGHDNSIAPRRHLLVPVLIILFVASLGLAWWYVQNVANDKRQAGADIVAAVGERGLLSYVAPRSGIVRWFRTNKRVDKVAVIRGKRVVVTSWLPIGWEAELMVAYPDGALGGLDIDVTRQGTGYEGHWWRWRLNEDMTVGKVYGGSLTVTVDGVEMTGGLLAEITPDEIILHHSERPEEVVRVPRYENFLPLAAIPLAVSVVHDEQMTGIIEVLDPSLQEDGWPVGVTEWAIAPATTKDARDLYSHAAAAAMLSHPATGRGVGVVYIESEGGVLAIDQWATEDIFASDNNYGGITVLQLGPASASPGPMLHKALAQVAARSGLLGTPTPEDPTPEDLAPEDSAPEDLAPEDSAPEDLTPIESPEE